MQLVVYLLVYPILWLVSKLPFRVLYFFSDILFFFIYTLFGYRKKVVLDNLTLTFPKKNEKELKKIRKEFYAHFCDTIVEMIKPMGMSVDEMKKRYHITNIDILKNIAAKKSVLIPCSHYANWEWNVSLSLHVTNAKGYAVYQKVMNPYFDALIKRNRAKWNTELITQQETVKTVLLNVRNKTNSVYGMVSDQSPHIGRAQYWSSFMGITVPIHNGTEILARKFDLAVIFLKVIKVKRGYYTAEFIPITLSGKETEPNEITETFLRLAEQQIKENPAHYLWTHKRWKHRDKVPG